MTRRVWDPDAKSRKKLGKIGDDPNDGLTWDFEKFKETPFGKCYLEEEAKCFDKGGPLKECASKAALKCMARPDLQWEYHGQMKMALLVDEPDPPDYRKSDEYAEEVRRRMPEVVEGFI